MTSDRLNSGLCLAAIGLCLTVAGACMYALAQPRIEPQPQKECAVFMAGASR